MKKPGSRKTTSAIKGKDWLSLKPYESFKPYDQAYVKIATRINNALQNHRDFLEDVFEVDQTAYSYLALILTSYLEDIVNEIGIWSVFIAKNEELYGYPLPFLNQEEIDNYESGDINEADTKYLIWHFLNIQKNSYFAPDSDLLALINTDVWAIIEKAWDDAPVTDFYDAYLTVADDIDFFQFKEKLTWFGMKSYPLFLEAETKNQASLEELLQGGNQGMRSEEDLRRFSYMIVDEYIMRAPTHYNAMQAIDWFAEVIRCSETFKKDCLSIKENIWGTFEYVENTDEHHILQYQGLDRIFKIRKDSMQIENTPNDEQILVMRIVPFKGEWFLSGLSSVFEKANQGDQFKNPSPAPFQVYEPEKQSEMLKRTDKMEKDFNDFFGGLFLRTKDHEELVKKATDYTQYQNNKQQGDLSDFDYTEHLKNNKKIMPSEPGTALAFVPKQGLAFEIGIEKWLDRLENLETATREEAGELLFHLAAEVYPENLLYILGHHRPNAPLLFPVKFSEMDFWPYLPFFSRYFQPENYGNRHPLVAEAK